MMVKGDCGHKIRITQASYTELMQAGIARARCEACGAVGEHPNGEPEYPKRIVYVPKAFAGFGVLLGRESRDSWGFEHFSWEVVALESGEVVADVRSTFDSSRREGVPEASGHGLEAYVPLLGDGRPAPQWFGLAAKIARWVPGYPKLADLLVTLRMAGALCVERLPGRAELVDRQAELLIEQAKAGGQELGGWDAKERARALVPHFREVEWPDWVVPIQVADGHEPRTEAAG